MPELQPPQIASREPPRDAPPLDRREINFLQWILLSRYAHGSEEGAVRWISRYAARFRHLAEARTAEAQELRGRLLADEAFRREASLFTPKHTPTETWVKEHEALIEEVERFLGAPPFERAA